MIQGNITGIELTSIVNQKYGTPVIYGTAHTDKATIRNCNKTIHCGILFKPFQLSELASAIEKVIA